MTQSLGKQIFPEKPKAGPRIYAYSIADESHVGQLKIEQTTRDVNQRIAEQVQTAAINYTIELDEPAAPCFPIMKCESL